MPTIEEVEVTAEIIPASANTAELFKPYGLDTIIARIRAEVTGVVSDISTERGRKEIASRARKVASSKVKLDDVGKELVAGIKTQAVAIDAERKRMRDTLDALKDEVRKPLTDWEEYEKNRIEGHEAVLREIMALHNAPFGATKEEIEIRIAAVDAYSTRDWQEFSKRAEDTIRSVTPSLRRLWEQTKQAEEQKLELARLQEAETKRLAEERDQRLRDEAAAVAKAQAEERARREADEVAIREAQERAAIERGKAKAEERAKAAEQAVKDAAERAVREQAAAVERERQRVADEAELERIATARREANTRRCGQINRQITTTLIQLGVTPEIARTIVRAMAKGEVENAKVLY